MLAWVSLVQDVVNHRHIITSIMPSKLGLVLVEGNPVLERLSHLMVLQHPLLRNIHALRHYWVTDHHLVQQ